MGFCKLTFNDQNPNIVVKATAQPWGTTWNQIEPLVAAGRAPDVAVVNEDQVTRFIARGALEEITGRIHGRVFASQEMLRTLQS